MIRVCSVCHEPWEFPDDQEADMIGVHKCPTHRAGGCTRYQQCRHAELAANGLVVFGEHANTGRSTYRSLHYSPGGGHHQWDRRYKPKGRKNTLRYLYATLRS